MTQPTQIGILPPEFAAAIHDLSLFDWDHRIHVTELEPPARLAPFSAAISAEIENGDDIIGTGRLILLHDPAGNESWDGTFRCVTYAQADVSPEMIQDPFLALVGWAWLTDALDARHARYMEPSGTVTTTASTPFGRIEDREATSEIEIRASWTPTLGPGHPLTDHLEAWQELLCEVSGIPTDESIAQLTNRIVAGK